MTKENTLKFLYCGDSALTVEFGDEISPEINAKVRALTDLLQNNRIKGIIDCVPTYRSLLIIYDNAKIKSDKLIKKLKSLLENTTAVSDKSKNIFVIPVCYEDEFAPDMANVCKHTGLSAEEIIKLHSSKDYLIYMLGFLPGFPYLGGLDKRLHTPRLPSPRTAIPEGSVGIGGEQTGIYPVKSPGGWQLIGMTPIKTYDAEREKPILYSAGDMIRFKPISKAEFIKIKELSDKNDYKPEIFKE